MTDAVATSQAKILRSVDSVSVDSDKVVLDVTAVAATTLGGMPGWLTAEPFRDQGVEVEMPNLPQDIEVPSLEPEPWQVVISGHGPRTLRVVTAPQSNRVFQEQPSWLGLVTDNGRSPIEVVESDDAVEVWGDSYCVRVTKNPFTLKVISPDGRTVMRTAERMRQVAGFPLAPPVLGSDRGVAMNFEIAAGESILGFGEMFGPLEKNGQQLKLRTDDALGTGTGLCYKPVPVWHSSAGYGAFVNTGTQMTADVGHQKPSVLGLELPDDVIDLFVFVSDDPVQRLTDYTDLTGRSVVPPLWAFGYWMGRCRYHSREEMLEVSRGMSEHNIPCDVLHLDPDWLVVDRLNTDFIWNEERFGPRREFIRELAESGRRLSLWELPYVDPASPRYAELESQGYMVKTKTGETALLEGTPTPDGRPRGLVDFSNPAARDWWKEQHRAFIDDGVAVFKTDFGEGFPSTGMATADIPQAHHHNLYPIWYNSATSEAIAEMTDRAPLVWGRSGWAGSHRYPGQWGGDAESTVAGMQATLRGGLSYAMSAPGFWSHDIGGFFGPELTPGLYVRWTQFGAFSPLMRAHGLRPREPWAFGEEALEISRDWIRRRYEFLPYLWQQAQLSVSQGIPMMRPLHLSFPGDIVARSVDDQFMLGDSMMVVPVFDDGTEKINRTYYLPNGRWTDLFTGEQFQGGRYHTVELSLHQMPVLVMDGSAIPRLEVPEGALNTDTLMNQSWELSLFGDTSVVGRSFVGFDGQTFGAEALPVRSTS